MFIRRRHALALTLSVTAHLGLCMMTGMNGGLLTSSAGAAGSKAIFPVAEKKVTVQLSTLETPDLLSALTTVSAENPLEKTAAHPSYFQNPVQQSVITPETNVEDTQSAPEAAPSTGRHFQLPELTQEPLVADGLMDGKILRIKEMTPHTIDLEVWVNDRGEVEKVLLENSGLPVETEQLVIENFLKVKFYPGRIGRIAVSSQFKMEILLDDLLGV